MFYAIKASHKGILSEEDYDEPAEEKSHLLDPFGGVYLLDVIGHWRVMGADGTGRDMGD